MTVWPVVERGGTRTTTVADAGATAGGAALPPLPSQTVSSIGATPAGPAAARGELHRRSCGRALRQPPRDETLASTAAAGSGLPALPHFVRLAGDCEPYPICPVRCPPSFVLCAPCSVPHASPWAWPAQTGWEPVLPVAGTVRRDATPRLLLHIAPLGLPWVRAQPIAGQCGRRFPPGHAQARHPSGYHQMQPHSRRNHSARLGCELRPWSRKCGKPPMDGRMGVFVRRTGAAVDRRQGTPTAAAYGYGHAPLRVSRPCCWVVWTLASRCAPERVELVCDCGPASSVLTPQPCTADCGQRWRRAWFGRLP